MRDFGEQLAAGVGQKHIRKYGKPGFKKRSIDERMAQVLTLKPLEKRAFAVPLSVIHLNHENITKLSKQSTWTSPKSQILLIHPSLFIHLYQAQTSNITNLLAFQGFASRHFHSSQTNPHSSHLTDFSILSPPTPTSLENRLFDSPQDLQLIIINQLHQNTKCLQDSKTMQTRSPPYKSFRKE